jgi:hypothetical protein
MTLAWLMLPQALSDQVSRFNAKVSGPAHSLGLGHALGWDGREQAQTWYYGRGISSLDLAPSLPLDVVGISSVMVILPGMCVAINHLFSEIAKPSPVAE